jgi:2,3-bisphosphoglycerate-dependent phosphoglycerate mutase
VTTIVLVRHARSAPSPELAERDWPLTDLGREQAKALAPVLAELKVEALVSSPYVRAIETLRPFAEARGLPILIDEDLCERELGGWLASPAEVEAVVRRMHADPDFKLQTGESVRTCLARFDAALARTAGANAGRRIAVASHGAILSHLLARHRTGLPEAFWRRIRNPHVFVFDFTGEPKWLEERTLDGAPGVLAA